jgi:hypothetical protein
MLKGHYFTIQKGSDTMEQQPTWLNVAQFHRSLNRLGVPASYRTVLKWKDKFSPYYLLRTPSGRTYIRSTAIDAYFKGKVSY